MMNLMPLLRKISAALAAQVSSPDCKLTLRALTARSRKMRRQSHGNLGESGVNRAMENPVLIAIRRAGFTPFGWFAPQKDDLLPAGCAFAILIGNAGPDMFRRYWRERTLGDASLDRWTRTAVSSLAASLDATAVFPFDKPALPFLRWARRAGAGHISPLGLNIHSQFGLWHAYRAALLFPVAFDLPAQSPGAHPCETCADKPCLSACPVNAFSGPVYDVDGCGAHLKSDGGTPCMDGGCLARRACPVGRGYTYETPQIRFHMAAFLRARSDAWTKQR